MLAKRRVLLGERTIELVGACPRVGMPLPAATFAIPAARNAIEPLRYGDLLQGQVFVSTLPNIGKHACAAQILGLEEALEKRAPEARLFHVSADEPRFWREVDLIHPTLRASGYSLFGVDSESVQAFSHLFGVAVVGTQRIAHGIFGIFDGFVTAAEIPDQQLGVPSIGRFLHRALSAQSEMLGVGCAAGCRHDQ